MHPAWHRARLDVARGVRCEFERRRFGVVELLQAFEDASDCGRLDGRAAYDFGWMWLGLDRPGATPE